MSKAVTETVEEPKPASIREHYEAAKAAAQSTDQGTDKKDETEETVDDTDDTTTQTAEPTEEAADQTEVTAETEDDELLSADEVAKLTGDARKQYDRMNKAFTTKTQVLAEKRKGVEKWDRLITALDTNPDQTLEELAAARGFKLSKSEKSADGKKVTTETPADQVKQEIDQALADMPDELKFLKPYFEKFAAKLTSSIDSKMKPIQESHQQMTNQAIETQTAATLKSFSTAHPGWEKHETKMLEIAQKIQPSGKMPEFEYLETLYNLATANQTNAERTKKVVDKINKSAAAAETVGSGVSEKQVVHALPSPDKRGIREAYEAAKRGERWSQE